MKIKIETEFIPLTLLGKIVSLISLKGKAIENNRGKIKSNIKIIEGKLEKDVEITYQIVYSAQVTNQILSNKWHPFMEGDSNWEITYPNAGISEFRLFFKNFDDNDIILDEFNGDQQFSYQSYGDQLISINTRYYSRPFRIISLNDLLLFFFAFVSGIGAIFEVLNFFLK